MTEIKEVYVTKIVHDETKQYGFARVIEDAEQVFIPPNTIREFRPNEGDRLVVQLIENKHEHSDVPWRMTMVYDEDGPFKHLIHKYKFKPASHVPVAPTPKPEPIKVEPTHEQICLEVTKFFLEHDDYFYVTRQVEKYVSDALDYEVGTKKMGRIIDWMHKQGHVSMLVLHKSPDQGRASRVAWCKSTNANEIFTLQFEEYEEDDT